MSAQAFGIARYVLAAYAENVPGDQYAPGNLANKIVEALYSAEKEDGYQLLLTGRIVAELYVMLMRSARNLIRGNPRYDSLGSKVSSGRLHKAKPWSMALLQVIRHFPEGKDQESWEKHKAAKK